MRTRSLTFACVLVFVAALFPPAAAAQERGGGILDWIHRLSGPQFFGPAVSYAVGGDDARFRISGALRWSVSSEEAIDPDDASITMISIQPTGEFRLFQIGSVPVEAGLGVGIHRYGGDADGFWHLSIPLYAQALVPLSDRLDLRLGLQSHYFFEFSSDAFEPLAVVAPRDGGEFVRITPVIGVDWRFF